MSGSDRLALPEEANELGERAFQQLASDPEAARSLAEAQLARILDEESRTGRPLHKGQPLHNLGILRYPEDPEAARILFFAAHLEDLRTYGGPAHAAEVLSAGYGLRPSAFDNLADFANDQAKDPAEDPRVAADRFAKTFGPFGAHRSYVDKGRDEAELEGIEAERLVFVGGMHTLFHHLAAIAEGVAEAGLVPVVVSAFADLDDENENDFSKSVRFMERCGAAIIDVSVPAGQFIELGLVYGLGLPAALIFSDREVDASLHRGMVQGIAATMKIKAFACTSTGQMTEEAKAWCISKRGGAAAPRRTTADVERAADRIRAMVSGSQIRPTPSGEGMAPEFDFPAVDMWSGEGPPDLDDD